MKKYLANLNQQRCLYVCIEVDLPVYNTEHFR